MSATMKDIANLAGVSIGTVDRALNNRGRINPDVKMRICAIAEQLNYKTNSLAKSLANYKKNHIIAVVLHIQQNDFYTDVVNGIYEAAHEIQDFGIQVKIYKGDNFNASMQLQHIEQAISDGATALVIVPIDHPNIRAKLEELYNENFPVVFLSSLLSNIPCLTSVHCDYLRSGWIGGKLLSLVTKGRGNALAFSPSFSMTGHRLRMESFIHYIAEECPDINLMKIIELPNDSLDDYRITREELFKYSQVNCVLFCGNTKSGLKAISECALPIKTVFYDFLPGTQEALLDGRIDAAIVQGPKEQGYKSIMVLHEYFTHCITPEPEIIINNTIILKESIEMIPQNPISDQPLY